MLELLARPELRLYPMRLLSTAGPCLGSIFGVLIFRKNFRIGTAWRPIGPNRAIGVFKPAQTFFELGLLLRYLASQDRSHLFVQAPQLICGRGFESIAFHRSDPLVLHGPRRPPARCKMTSAKRKPPGARLQMVTSFRFGTMEKAAMRRGVILAAHRSK